MNIYYVRHSHGDAYHHGAGGPLRHAHLPHDGLPRPGGSSDGPSGHTAGTISAVDHSLAAQAATSAKDCLSDVVRHTKHSSKRDDKGRGELRHPARGAGQRHREVQPRRGVVPGTAQGAERLRSISENELSF